MTAPALARRVRPATAISGGLALSVPGCLLVTLADPAGGLPAVILGIGILALGAGPLFALGTSLVIGSVPPARPARRRRCRRQPITSAPRWAWPCSG